MQSQEIRQIKNVDETAVLVLAVLTFAVIFSLGYVGRVLAPYSKGPVGWEVMTPDKAALVLRSHTTGPECIAHIQGAQMTLKDRDIEVDVAGMGKVAVQSHNYGEYTVQPLTALSDASGCRWNPPVPFDWLKE
jgi:hypothetical protein